MKLPIILLLVFATALRAQVPHIDYMIADEAKSQLQIHGTFGPDQTGFATIENTKQTVRSWSDTMVISDLPDSGAGSGGHVTVTQMSGTSNVRMLSIIEATIGNPFFYIRYLSHVGFVYDPGAGQSIWSINWRADIASRPNNVSTFVRFEISKSSVGKWSLNDHTVYDLILVWSDSSHFSDSSITLFGELDLVKMKINFEMTLMQSFPDNGAIINNPSVPYLESYKPSSLDFDATGYLTGYQHEDTIGGVSNSTLEKRADYLNNQKILFPPSTKNAVRQSPQPTSDLIKILSYFGSEEHLISLEAEEPLGETTASLYSIDGRLLKEEKISIPTPGIYSFDASGINARFGFLVIKTSKGIVAGKVVF